ncbi:M23 family metallopeptidase [Corynebacterium lizhenjunii]|uniref:M23 family metallopeptidase n=1 Tax=Corynebacterium lizhenjunii TaxID=2709394 RepID=A0A7T0KEV7_9CORY|nr:M23 family metallopeptidase [Corynebacterium lizhenjunii]QPK78423.1 M23 family metallopeptidase [Corynebacterium lizhenjunii]
MNALHIKQFADAPSTRLLRTLLAGWLTLTLVASATPAASGSPPPRNPAIAAAHGYYQRPVDGRVLRAFDKPEHKWSRGHRGVDLAAPIGATVYSAGEGTVSFAGSVAGRPSVSVTHPDGLRTTYTPVIAHVQAGETVAAGTPLGILDRSYDGYPGLHWGALQGPDDYIDPLSLLQPPRIRLKPV